MVLCAARLDRGRNSLLGGEAETPEETEGPAQALRWTGTAIRFMSAERALPAATLCHAEAGGQSHPRSGRARLPPWPFLLTRSAARSTRGTDAPALAGGRPRAVDAWTQGALRYAASSLGSLSRPWSPISREVRLASSLLGRTAAGSNTRYYDLASSQFQQRPGADPPAPPPASPGRCWRSWHMVRRANPAMPCGLSGATSARATPALHLRYTEGEGPRGHR